MVTVFITFFMFCSIKLYQLFWSCHFEVSLLCTPKGLGWSFPVNFNYPKCLENSNMISFVLTNWVTSKWQILLFFCFVLFHKIVSTFLNCQLEVSLLSTPKGSESEFSGKLQLPKMSWKFKHDQFCINKLGNFKLTDLISFSCFAP